MKSDQKILAKLWRKCDKGEKIGAGTRKKMERYLLGAFKAVRRRSKDQQMVQIKDALVEIDKKLKNIKKK